MRKGVSWIVPPIVVLSLLFASGLACGGRGEQEQPSSPPTAVPAAATQAPAAPSLAAAPVVRFLSPPAGTQVAVGRQIYLQARAFARGGLNRVEFSVDGTHIASLDAPSGQRLYVAAQAWTPQAAGTYLLAATAYDDAGKASAPAQVSITVQESFPSGGEAGAAPSGGEAGGEEPSGESGEAPSGGEAGEAPSGGEASEGESGGEAGGEAGGGESPVVEPYVDFRADSTQVQAGESTILRWDVENVREVYLDGQGVVGHGTREVWPFPPSQMYILHVVFQNGEAQDYTVTIDVAGEVQLVSGPDLVVLAVDAPESREPDESIPFQAEVLNAGDVPAQGAEWRWSINRGGDGPATWNMGSQFNLEVGQTTLLRGEAPPHSQGRWTIYIEVRVEGDDNTGNNRGSDDFSVFPAEDGGGGIILVPDPPLAPILCSANAFSSTEVWIEWGEEGMSPDEEGFRIYLAVTALVAEIPIPNYSGHTIRDLEPNTQYHFDVRAYNAGGESPADACAVDVTTLP